jgi:proton-dependent oligopeptide transporter, POT family
MGPDHAIVHGGVGLLLGYLLLACLHTHAGLLLSMALLVWGNGLLKPNISSLLGACYAKEDRSRDRGFTVYYLGINIGAIMGVLSAGWVAMHWGYHAAFALLALGMLLGLLTYLLGRHHIVKSIKQKHVCLKGWGDHAISLMLGVPVILGVASLLNDAAWLNTLLSVSCVLLLVWLVMKGLKQKSEERAGMLMCVLLTAASIAFWALYMQMGSSLVLYISRCVDTHLLGMRLSPSMVASANGIWLLALGPVVVRLWQWLGARGWEPSTQLKFMMAIAWMGLGYAVLAVSTASVQLGQGAHIDWVLGSYGLQTLGELCLSPIGLAMITQRAPEGMKSVMMGVWFLGTAVASALSGRLARISVIPHDVHSPVVMAALYKKTFLVDAALSLGVVLMLVLVLPYLNRLMRQSDAVSVSPKKRREVQWIPS